MRTCYQVKSTFQPKISFDENFGKHVSSVGDCLEVSGISLWNSFSTDKNFWVYGHVAATGIFGKFPSNFRFYFGEKFLTIRQFYVDLLKRLNWLGNFWLANRTSMEAEVHGFRSRTITAQTIEDFLNKNLFKQKTELNLFIAFSF